MKLEIRSTKFLFLFNLFAFFVVTGLSKFIQPTQKILFFSHIALLLYFAFSFGFLGARTLIERRQKKSQ